MKDKIQNWIDELDVEHYDEFMNELEKADKQLHQKVLNAIWGHAEEMVADKLSDEADMIRDCQRDGVPYVGRMPLPAKLDKHIKKVNMLQCTCYRCGHEWIPRYLDMHDFNSPKFCPKCKSPYWNVPKQR